MGNEKLDPKIKRIANEYEKEIRMTDKTVEIHLQEDSSQAILSEEEGLSIKSSLNITIAAASGLELKGKTVRIHSDGPLSFTGQASGLLIDGSTIHLKAPLVSQKK